MNEDLITLAHKYQNAVEILKEKQQDFNKLKWSDGGYRAAYTGVMEQDYEVSKLYKSISTEKTKLWREAKNG